MKILNNTNKPISDKVDGVITYVSNSLNVKSVRIETDLIDFEFPCGYHIATSKKEVEEEPMEFNEHLVRKIVDMIVDGFTKELFGKC